MDGMWLLRSLFLSDGCKLWKSPRVFIRYRAYPISAASLFPSKPAEQIWFFLTPTLSFCYKAQYEKPRGRVPKTQPPPPPPPFAEPYQPHPPPAHPPRHDLRATLDRKESRKGHHLCRLKNKTTPIAATPNAAPGLARPKAKPNQASTHSSTGAPPRTS